MRALSKISDMEDNCYLRLNDTFCASYPATFQDIDPDYRVKITAYLAYFQDTVAAFMTTRNIAAFDVAKKDIMWVISDITFADGGNDAMWRDDLLTEIRLSEISSFRVYFDYTIKGTDGTVFASGTGVWVPVSRHTGKPLSITEFCQILEPADSTPAVKHGKFRYIDGPHTVLETSSPVTPSELDFNRHMGNRSYVEFALRGIPDDFNQTHHVQNLMVKFEKQTYLGDTVTCRYNMNADNENLYLVKLSNSAQEQVCTIQIEWSTDPRPIPNISATVRR